MQIHYTRELGKSNGINRDKSIDYDYEFMHNVYSI